MSGAGRMSTGLRSLWTSLLAFFGCAGGFHTTTTVGVDNVVQIAPGMWRMGQPSPEAWPALARLVNPEFKRVTVVKLDDEDEGSDDYVLGLYGWTLVKVPMPPFDDKPWTVLEKPDKASVNRAMQSILDARARGEVVVWHCVHGRDRTGLISALVGMRLFGWSKAQAWQDMIAHGFRWELPDLDAYWLTEVT